MPLDAERLATVATLSMRGDTGGRLLFYHVLLECLEEDFHFGERQARCSMH
jgi:hypothetical protein